MTLDPKGRRTAGFRRHAFVCGHERSEGSSRPSCLPKGSLEVMVQLKSAVKEAGLGDVRVQKSGCLDHCEYGPTCVVYPEGTWYGLTSEAVIQAVLHHLKTGEINEEATLQME